MRRMNSMLLGHQGASGRTDCMYFSIASSVAGSSHDSGRWTMRAGSRYRRAAAVRARHARRCASKRVVRQLRWS